VLGIDLGAKRIGIAISDRDRQVATPVQVLLRSGNPTVDHTRIAGLVDEWEASLVVIGVPYSLDGHIGAAAEAVLAEVALIRAALSVTVDLYDERLSTVTAERSLMHQDLRAPKRRQVVDMVAAAVVLQGWLDAEAARSHD
jgi:putative holliday junction resolvase